MARNRSRRGAREDDDEPDIEIQDEDGNVIDETALFADEIDTDPALYEDPPASKAAPEPDAFEILQRESEAAKHALAAERTKVKDLEARVDAHGGDLDATNAALLKHAAAMARGEVEAAKAAYATAMAASDFAAAADAQTAIAEAVAQAREYEAAGVEFAREVEQRKKAPPKREAAPAVSDDPAEQIISQMTPASGAWLRKNKAVAFKSQASWSRTIAAHHAAVEAGHEVDSPAYFQSLEAELNITEPTTTAKTTVKPPVKRAPPNAAAPVSRGTTGSAGSITLTADERKVAQRMGMSLAKYGSYKKKAQEAAKDPDYRGPLYSQDSPAIAQSKGR